MQPITVLPVEIQDKWQANLIPALPGPAYRLVSIVPTRGGYQEQRITVEVTDANGLPLTIPVAFSYSTAARYTVSPSFTWSPPVPHKAHITMATFGLAEEVQGSPVKDGEPGGMTVYVFDPRYPSDIVTGLGMLADHTGLRLRFELQQPGMLSFGDRLAALEERVTAIWGYIGPVSGEGKGQGVV